MGYSGHIGKLLESISPGVKCTYFHYDLTERVTDNAGSVNILQIYFISYYDFDGWQTKPSFVDSKLKRNQLHIL